MSLEKFKKLNQKKSIVCYKTFYSIPNDNGGFSMLSPTVNCQYEMGTVYSTNTTSPEIKYSILIVKGQSIKSAFITGNSLHSFKTLYGAKKFAEYLSNHRNAMPVNTKSIVVVKCVIPENSNFTYKGRFIKENFNLRAFASEKLKPLEIIKSYPFNRNVLP